MGNSHTPLPTDYILSEKAEQILTQEINNVNPYGEESPLLQGQYPYPVVFEPIRHIKLSRSTYKVTSFIDFTPHIRAFDSFEKYLDDLSRDMNDTSKMGILQHLKETFKEDFSKLKKEGGKHFGDSMYDMTDTCDFDIEKECEKFTRFINSCYGEVRDICNTKRKYRKLVSIVGYIRQDFQRTRDHFLKAIDHVQEKIKVANGTKREKRDTEKVEIILEAYDQIDRNDYELAREILEKLGKIDIKTGKIQTRQKRFGIMNWIMGWGIFSNARNIKQIKRNIRTLYLQNQLQERQIQDLAHYLNLTATHVQLQGKMINEIQTRLENINFQLVNLHLRMNFHIHISGMLQDMGTAVNRLLAGLISIRNNVDKIYEYMRVMATHKVHPALLPPDPLRELLRHIKDKMRENPRLELPYDPDKSIWRYYEIMKITPIIVEDLMVVLLTIPLTDKSLSMNVYKAHNLPAVNPEVGMSATYQLEGEYLAVGQHGLYAAIPKSRDILLCLVSRGGLCVMNEALHPVETLEWCIYALFIQNKDKINKYCEMDFKNRKTSLAQSLGGYMWAVSSLAGEKIQIRCLTETHVQEIKPPLQIIYVGNGCEGYSPSIMIPARSELTSRYQIMERKTYFLEFNTKYESMHQLGPWIALPLDELPKEVVEKLIKKLPELPPMSFENLDKRIGDIDEDYPIEIPIPVLFACQIGGLILLLLGGLGMGWKIYKTRRELQSSLAMFVKGDNKGKDFQKLMSTLMNVYTGLPQQPSTSTTPSKTATSTKGGTTPSTETEIRTSPEEKGTGQQIEEVILQVLKKGSDVKRLGKYYEKQQSKV